jgi:hypothetical protein
MIWVHSLVSQKTGEGVVEFTWGEKRAQLSCDEARKHAQGIFECAEAAETDAFLVEFLQKIGTERDSALKILVEFRSFREERANKQ